MGLSASSTEEERAIIAQAIRQAEGAVKKYLRYDPVSRERTEYYPLQDVHGANQATVWVAEGNEAIRRREIEGGLRDLSVKHRPIRSIASINVDYNGRSGTASGAFGSDTLKAEGTDFWPNYDREDSDGERMATDGVIRHVGTWPVEPGTIKIKYTAGYTEEELRGTDAIVDASPIHNAVLQESVRRARATLVNKKHTSIGHVAGTIVSERMGDYSYAVDGKSAQSVATIGTFDLMASSMSELDGFVSYALDL